MKRIIVSGRSGSGKSVALRALEDHGFYCVDNIPIELIPNLLQQVDSHYLGLAIGIDARNINHSEEDFDQLIKQIKQNKFELEVIFIDAADTTLLKRFSETRRRHPLTAEGYSLAEAIQQEKQRLEPVTRYAQLIIDTTTKSPHELCSEIVRRVLNSQSTRLNLMFTSFGFKHGAPTDADFVFDARCLPNPYWEESLRPYNGKDKCVIEYLDAQPIAQEFSWQLKIFLQTWLPRIEQDHRNYLTVAVGCTGGQHRSVYITEKLAKNLRSLYPGIQVHHRELDKNV